MPKGLLLTLMFFLGWASILHAQENQEEIRNQLNKIQSSAKALSKQIYQTKYKERKLVKQLESFDKEIGEYNEKLRELFLQKKQLDTHIASLLKEKNELNTLFYEHQGGLQLLIKERFGDFENERFKLLLNQTDLASLARIDAYYQLIYKQRSQEIEKVKKYLSQIKQNHLAIEKQKNDLKKLIKTVQVTRKVLHKKKKQRKHVLASLQDELKTQSQQQNNIKKEEQHLIAILQHLQESTKPKTEWTLQPLSAQKGLLPSPLKHLDPQKSTDRQNKNFMAAKAGTPIYAIADGRVIFSQWLRGIGLLLIIDHGEGFLSLYGNTQILYKNVGERVKQAEQIARVGESGTYGLEGLYFEIRKDGLALNTRQWLQKS